MSSLGEMHKAKAQELFTHYMRAATGHTDSDTESEWDEIIERIIDAAVAESKEIYAAPPAKPLEAEQDDLQYAVDNGGELDLALPNGAHVWLWRHRLSAPNVYIVRVQEKKYSSSYPVDEWTEFAPAFAAHIAQVRRLTDKATA